MFFTECFLLHLPYFNSTMLEVKQPIIANFGRGGSMGLPYFSVTENPILTIGLKNLL